MANFCPALHLMSVLNLAHLFGDLGRALVDTTSFLFDSRNGLDGRWQVGTRESKENEQGAGRI